VKRLAFLLTALTAAGVLGWPAAAAARSCQALSVDVNAATGSADVAALESLYKEASDPAAGCSDRYRVCLGRMVAHAYVDRAYDAHDRKRPASELDALVDKAIDWAQSWKVLLARAELHEEEKRYDEASYFYQAALNDLSDGTVCPGEEAGFPDEVALASIFDRAAVAGLLAKDFVTPPADRAGAPGGIFLPSVRGLAPKERSLPVEFEYDSDIFTPKGLRAAEALADYLARNKGKYEVVRLSGHTDERGSGSYNCALSQRRLAAIGGYLNDHGVADIPYELYPQGEGDPIRIDDPSRYSEEELYQVNRRVVLIEGPPPATRACP
jgi:peptidoglycan-associated lipoprotein